MNGLDERQLFLEHLVLDLTRRPVVPACDGRERHQNALRPAAGSQAEVRPAIVEEVELDIATAAQTLPGAVTAGERLLEPALDDRKVRRHDRVRAARYERKHRTG